MRRLRIISVGSAALEASEPIDPFSADFSPHDPHPCHRKLL